MAGPSPAVAATPRQNRPHAVDENRPHAVDENRPHAVDENRALQLGELGAGAGAGVAIGAIVALAFVSLRRRRTGEAHARTHGAGRLDVRTAAQGINLNMSR